MRLYEVISFLPKTTTKSYDDRIKRKSNVPSSRVLGRGHFSTVQNVDSPKRLNQVSKTGRAGRVGLSAPRPIDILEKDGYLSYIKMVNEFEEEGRYNPYFPRIHKLKLYRTPTGNLEYDADIEKLYPLNASKITTNEPLMNSIYHDMFEVEREPEESITGSTIARQLDLISQGEFGNVKSLKDDNLHDALELIDIVRTNNGLTWDLGAQNFMWRITGTRPQLVFTDPLA